MFTAAEDACQETVDILVNSAASTTVAILEAVASEDRDSMMNMNLHSALILSENVATSGKGMIARRSGPIVNISLAAASECLPEHAAWVGSKAALNLVTRQLSSEACSYNIRKNEVAPKATEASITNCIAEHHNSGNADSSPPVPVDRYEGVSDKSSFPVEALEWRSSPLRILKDPSPLHPD